MVSSRVARREETRSRIVEAAITAFAERGFHGASTREIATRASVNQGLITHHFGTKDALWREAMTRTFRGLEHALQERFSREVYDDPRERAREVTREFVRYAARHPALFRLMVDEGKVADDRLTWLVETFLRPAYESFVAVGDIVGFGEDSTLAAHYFYLLAGAASLMFVVGPECKRLTGVDPDDPATVERHADLVARMLVP